MSTFDSPHPRSRSRRRLAAWLAFGAVGLATGAVWATGFATVGEGSTGNNVTSPALTRTDPAAQADRLAGTIAEGTDPVYDFEGFQGSVAATSMYTVDLSGQPATEDFNVAVLLSTATPLAGWSSIQLKFDMVDDGGDGCTAADFPVGAETAGRVMRFDSQDARVNWNTVPGNAKYCIGLRASDGRASGGTWLQSASETVAPTVFPQFIGTVDRAAS